MRRITDDSPRSIGEINSSIPPWLCRLIQLLQEKPAAQRIQTAEQTEQILQQCMAHLEQPSAKSIPEILQPSKSNRSLFIGTALAILCLTLIAIPVLWRPKTQPPTPIRLPIKRQRTKQSTKPPAKQTLRSQMWLENLLGMMASINRSWDATEQIDALDQSTQTNTLEFTGRLPTNVVWRARDQHRKVTQAYIQSVGDYNKSLDFLNYLTGTLLAKSGVQLSEIESNPLLLQIGTENNH